LERLLPDVDGRALALDCDPERVVIRLMEPPAQLDAMVLPSIMGES
jgi:hypothetical protein